MNRLLINTANDGLVVVLEKQGRVFHIIETNSAHHNETMLPKIDELLNSQNVSIRDIDQFGVVVGPGSFTGIRVGIATIKAFRDALNVEAVGINNLELLFSLAHKQCPDIKTVAILGSRNSYFVARLVNGYVYSYERNLTLDELKNISCGETIGVYKEDPNFDCFVVNIDPQVMLDLMSQSNDKTLSPIYFQLSQAEFDKLKKSNLEIVEATRNDISKIAEIESACIHSDHMSPNNIEVAVNDKNYKTFVAKLDDEIVGYIILEITDEVNISSISVLPKYRNIGVATSMINKAFELAKTLKLNLSLEVSDKNIPAFLLYQKLGFETRRVRKKYYSDGTNCLEMVKRV